MSTKDSIEQLNSLTPIQREVALKILKDTLEKNKSTTLNEMLETDYDEIPVDIDTFLTDPRYLGKFTNNGKNLTYRKWPEALREWFPNPLAPSPYVEIALTGAIGLGKSTNFDYAACYFLYKLMCLKDPNSYYGQPGATLWFCFFNNTLNSANSAAYAKFQAMLQSSPWFMERGTLSGVKNVEYIPNKNIRFMIGSTLQHTLGINIIFACLPEGTIVKTIDGDIDIKNLVGTNKQYYSLDDNKEIIESEKAEVKKVAEVKELIEIELEDNTKIKCTPDHMFLLKNGNYKAAELLTEDDEIEDKKDWEFIEYWKQFNIKSEYNMKRYIKFISNIQSKGERNLEQFEKHHIVPKSLLENDNLIKLTPREHFIAHHILARALGNKMVFAFHIMSHTGKYKVTSRKYEELKKLLVYELKNNPIGWAKPEFWTEEKRKEISKINKKIWSNPEFKTKMCKMRKGSGNSMYGKKGNKSPMYNRISVTNGIESKYIKQEELQHYLDLGWYKGRQDNVSKNISKSKTHYKYIYKDKEFTKINGKNSIREYLQKNGFPTISQITIYKLYNNLYNGPTSYTRGNVDYSELIGKIRRVPYEN